MFPSRAGARCIFLSFRGPASGSNNFLFGGGLNSGALRAPELKTASRTPARSARRLPRKIFLIFVEIFCSFGSRILVNFLPFWSISGAIFSYPVFSYRVSGVY